jgi:hypothetical protein
MGSWPRPSVTSELKEGMRAVNNSCTLLMILNIRNIIAHAWWSWIFETLLHTLDDLECSKHCTHLWSWIFETLYTLDDPEYSKHHCTHLMILNIRNIIADTLIVLISEMEHAVSLLRNYIDMLKTEPTQSSAEVKGRVELTSIPFLGFHILRWIYLLPFCENNRRNGPAWPWQWSNYGPSETSVTSVDTT